MKTIKHYYDAFKLPVITSGQAQSDKIKRLILSHNVNSFLISLLGKMTKFDSTTFKIIDVKVQKYF
jgi:hypothetical protein